MLRYSFVHTNTLKRITEIYPSRASIEKKKTFCFPRAVSDDSFERDVFGTFRERVFAHGCWCARPLEKTFSWKIELKIFEMSNLHSYRTKTNFKPFKDPENIDLSYVRRF